MILYECETTVSRGYRDSDNYPASTEDTKVVGYHSLEMLYEELARLKKLEREEDGYGDSVSVYFEQIREIEVISETSVDLNILYETEVWKKHKKDLEERSKRNAERLVREAEEAELREEQREKEELKRLMAKYVIIPYIE